MAILNFKGLVNASRIPGNAKLKCYGIYTLQFAKSRIAMAVFRDKKKLFTARYGGWQFCKITFQS